jgi:hypothetical protein
MTSHDRHRHMDVARVRAELTVHDLWLRYVALGGTGDAFDLDGYLQGLVPLETFQQDVVAQALNEALDELYRASRVPLSTRTPGGEDDEHLRRLVDELLQSRLPEPRPDNARPSDSCS